MIFGDKAISSHLQDGQMGCELFGRSQLSVVSVAFGKLDDEYFEPMADRSQGKAKRSRGLSFAISGVDLDVTFFHFRL